MRGTTRRSGFKMFSWPFLALLLTVQVIPSPLPTHQVAVLSFRAVLQVFSSPLPEATSVCLTHLLSSLTFTFILFFSSHLRPFPLVQLSSFLLVSVSFISNDKTHLSLASGPQVFSPYILIVCLLQYFTFLSFSLNNLCNRKARRT